MEAMHNGISYQSLEPALIKTPNFHEMEAWLLGQIHGMTLIERGADIDRALFDAKKLEQVARGQREAIELAKRTGISHRSARDFRELLERDLTDLRRCGGSR